MAEAAKGGPLARRMDDVAPVLEELPDWVDVADDNSIDGFDTRIDLDDEINAYTDPAEDGLEEALADQPGIDDVFAEDREVVFLRTRLALPDVKAAVVRAVVEVNRNPRPRPRTDKLTDDEVMSLADQVAPLLTAAGFQRGIGRWSPVYFHRAGEDGFVQVLFLSSLGGELTDGTRLEGRVQLLPGVRIPELASREIPAEGLSTVAPADCTLSWFEFLSPQVLVETVRQRTLPDLEASSSRRGLARWVAGDPSRVRIPAERPRYARLFAQWGQDEAAAAVLDHLRREWPHLARSPVAVEARAILEGRSR